MRKGTIVTVPVKKRSSASFSQGSTSSGEGRASCSATSWGSVVAMGLRSGGVRWRENLPARGSPAPCRVAPMFPRYPAVALFVVLLVLGGGAVAGGQAAEDLCEPRRAGEQCGPGNGRRTAGGGEKVPHKGWPAITGILWKVLGSHNARKTGGPDNDELLGHHGSDRIQGMAGKDVLWGDWDPKINNGRQRDVLRGGAGDDWIYPSHGRTVVDAGP